MVRLAVPFLLLTGCCAAAPERGWACDDQGRVIVARVPEAQRTDAIMANVRLTSLRIRQLDGERWIDAARLTKAEGCE